VIGLGERSDIPRLLAAADLVVSSSAYGEGFSNAIAEGMACGLVPVTTDVGDARDIVGETGEVVKPGEPEALSRAMARVLALDPEVRMARGGEARGRIERLYSLDKAADRFVAIYRDTPRS
jgi:glycosyltransferase involved in cell wall biosynthesis